METQPAVKWNPQVRGKPIAKPASPRGKVQRVNAETKVALERAVEKAAARSAKKVADEVPASRGKTVVPLEAHRAYQRVPDKKGKVHVCNGDGVAQLLLNKEINEIYEIVAKKTGIAEKELRAKYHTLNLGMQRMNLGNRLRKVLSK